MIINPKYILHNDSIIHYAVFGEGRDVLLCIHGYGQSSEAFYFLKDILGKKYTLIALDLPFHGKTDWKGKPITIKDMEGILTKMGIFLYEKISVLAFSYGCRLALFLVGQYGHRIKQVVLMSPDGILDNPLRRLISHTILGRAIFFCAMYFPKGLYKFINMALRFPIGNKPILLFIAKYLQNPSISRLVYKRWTYLRFLETSAHMVQRSIKKNGIYVDLIFGKVDGVVNAKSLYAFKNKNVGWVTITTLKAGHFILSKKFSGVIARAFRI